MDRCSHEQHVHGLAHRRFADWLRRAARRACHRLGHLLRVTCRRLVHYSDTHDTSVDYVHIWLHSRIDGQRLRSGSNSISSPSSAIPNNVGISSPDARVRRGWDALRWNVTTVTFLAHAIGLPSLDAKKATGIPLELSCYSNEASECVRCLNVIWAEVEER